jgi:hypothetical protein
VTYAALLCAVEYVQERSAFPPTVQAQFIDALSQISSDFNPFSGRIRELQVKLKRLAPDFFRSPNIRCLTRTVSLVEVESANNVAAASNKKRAITPICESEDETPLVQEPTCKRRKT